jgi:hypothetical protein
MRSQCSCIVRTYSSNTHGSPNSQQAVQRLHPILLQMPGLTVAVLLLLLLPSLHGEPLLLLSSRGCCCPARQLACHTSNSLRVPSTMRDTPGGSLLRSPAQAGSTT